MFICKFEHMAMSSMVLLLLSVMEDAPPSPSTGLTTATIKPTATTPPQGSLFFGFNPENNEPLNLHFVASQIENKSEIQINEFCLFDSVYFKAVTEIIVIDQIQEKNNQPVQTEKKLSALTLCHLDS